MPSSPVPWARRPSSPSSPAACTATFAYRDLTTVASNTFTTFPTAVILCGSGIHAYPVRIRGRYALDVTPLTEGNMKFQVSIVPAVQSGGLWIANGTPNVLGSNDAYTSMAVSYTAPSAVSTGDYLVRIESIAEPGNANTQAFPSYGSVGAYTLRIRNSFV